MKGQHVQGRKREVENPSACGPDRGGYKQITNLKILRTRKGSRAGGFRVEFDFLAEPERFNKSIKLMSKPPDAANKIGCDPLTGANISTFIKGWKKL